jgi:hypothetical protein
MTSEELANEMAKYFVAELDTPEELKKAFFGSIFKEIKQEERAKLTHSGADV